MVLANHINNTIYCITVFRKMSQSHTEVNFLSEFFMVLSIIQEHIIIAFAETEKIL